MATTSELGTRITEVETAIHDLMVGKRVARITSPDGTQAEYSETELPSLERYLNYLQGQLTAKQSNSSIGPGPIYILPA